MNELEPGPAPPSELRQIVAHSLLSGLCPLIPLPLLDDWARDLLRRKLVGRLTGSGGFPLAEDQVKVLANGISSTGPGGCLVGCLVRPLIFLSQLIFRKLMRKILFFLTLRDTVNTFSDTFHEGYLVRHAIERGALASVGSGQPVAPTRGGRPVDPQVLAVRQSIERSVRATDTRPVTSLVGSLLGGSRRSLMLTARRMARLVRRGRRADEQKLSEQLREEGEARLGDLIDELTADLARQDSYLRHLEADFDARLESETTAGG